VEEEIRPLGGRVLARFVEEEAVTKGGLVIQDTARGSGSGPRSLPLAMR